MVIEETPSVTIAYCFKTNGILVRWQEITCLDGFKEVYGKVFDFAVKQYKIKHYCIDLRLAGALTREQENWLTSYYYNEVNRVIKDCISIAVVFSEEHFKAIIRNYYAAAEIQQHDFIQFNYFTDVKEAEYWLCSIQKGQDTAVDLQLS